MESIFKALKTSRKLYTDLFERHTLEQLNKIPAGFNNNLIWNIGHVIAAQQSLVYKLSGLPMNISDELFERYKPGTKPGGPVSENEADELKALLINLVNQTEDDFYSKRFTQFHERRTATGFHIGSLKDAFQFNNYHEGLHLGYMMSLRKFI